MDRYRVLGHRHQSRSVSQHSHSLGVDDKKFQPGCSGSMTERYQSRWARTKLLRSAEAILSSSWSGDGRFLLYTVQTARAKGDV